MTEEKQQEYDIWLHVPQQIENLIQARAQANPELFNHVLSGLYQTLKDEKKFIDGVDLDQETLQDEFDACFTTLKNNVKKALEAKNNVDMVNHLKQAVALFDNDYAVSQQQFMDNVHQTCMTFIQSL